MGDQGNVHCHQQQHNGARTQLKVMEGQWGVWLAFAIFLMLLILAVVGACYLKRIPKADKPRRWLGITCPWDYRSLLSVVAFGLLELTFWAILWPSFDGSTAAVVLGLHVTLAAVTVMLWLIMITWDPRKALMISDTDPRSQALRAGKSCDKCDLLFAGKKRYHCPHCKYCISGFDHHCWFLNVCISHDSNYYGFLAILISDWLLVVLQAVLCTIVMCGTFPHLLHLAQLLFSPVIDCS